MTTQTSCSHRRFCTLINKIDGQRSDGFVIAINCLQNDDRQKRRTLNKSIGKLNEEVRESD